MKLRDQNVEKPKQLTTREKSNQTNVDGRQKNVKTQGALISLPLEKVTEKKTQKGEPDSRAKITIEIFTYR